MSAFPTHNACGRSSVRLIRVAPLPDRHEIRELTVAIRLEGDFDVAYTGGDNTQIIPLGTMQDAVYAQAQIRPPEAIEDFAAAVANHFLINFPHVRSVGVEVVEHPWYRIAVEGAKHPHAFIGGGSETRVAIVVGGSDGLGAEAGLDGLVVLKTVGPGFAGILRDEFADLPKPSDRIVATAVRARWTYAPDRPVAWDDARSRVRGALIAAFADHERLDVESTLHAMGTAALAAVPEADQLTLTLPNRHRTLVELRQFSPPNANEVFVTTDEPAETITGTFRRA